ncbi:MAG TPA: YraN family protein [Candidatus Polarisedimenticolia bacterium]
MSRERQDLGLSGEELAAEHLASRGYKILARRYRTRLGEIDLVAALGGLLVFVEVKARRGGGFGAPAEAVHARKQARIMRVAQLFLLERLPRGEVEPSCRFDVISITWEPGRLAVIDHIEDAFRPSV